MIKFIFSLFVINTWVYEVLYAFKLCSSEKLIKAFYIKQKFADDNNIDNVYL